MSDVTDRLRAFLTISPSVVFPDEVFELFEPVETEVTRLTDENAKLRELVAHYERAVTVHDVKPVEVLEWSVRCDALRKELGME